MDQKTTKAEMTSAKEADVENRRDAVKKLGKYAAYAAPFTLLAANATAQESGAGSSGYQSSQSKKAARH